MQEDNGALMRELLAGKHILIVDDDDDYAEALDEVFTLQGCEVTRISDPLVAMSHALNHEYDLMIVDKNMPCIDGLEFAQRIRKQKPASKIILITAHPDEESRTRSREIGIRYFLTKPFRKNELLENASFVML